MIIKEKETVDTAINSIDYFKVYLIDSIEEFVDLSLTFCELVKLAVKSRKILRVMHLYEDGNPNNISFYVDLHKPCCFLHAIFALEDEFKKRWKKRYNKEVENFIAQPLEEYDFHVSGVEVISEDDEALTIVFYMGSN